MKQQDGTYIAQYSWVQKRMHSTLPGSGPCSCYFTLFTLSVIDSGCYLSFNTLIVVTGEEALVPKMTDTSLSIGFALSGWVSLVPRPFLSHSGNQRGKGIHIQEEN